MLKTLRSQFDRILFAQSLFLLAAGQAFPQDSKVMGEVRFEGKHSVDRESGVWIDGGYVGYVKELKDDKKVLLLPGQHEIVVRQSGYDDFVQRIVVEPRQKQTVRVAMRLSQ